MFSFSVLLGVSLCSPLLSLHTEHVTITPEHVVQEIDDMFVGVTIDSSQLHHSEFIDNLRSPKLLNYVQPLKPAYVRVGGTSGDQTNFDLKSTKIHVNRVNGINNYVVPGIVWDELNLFCHKSGLKLIFGFNALERKNGKWDPTNTEALLQYSSQEGYEIAGFELGNEPNLFYRHSAENVSNVQLGADFMELEKVLQTTSYKNSLLLGPDTAGYVDFFIKTFLSHGGSVVDVVTFHHYYMNGAKAHLSDFTNYKTLDHLKSTVVTAVATANRQHPRKVAWLGETSSAYGGGAVSISDRYVAGFLWLDKLGISARYGLKGVMRQALYGGHYGLLQSSLEPNPDYWLTVLYKRLVGNKVFDVKTSSHNIRVYAHCTRRQNQYNYKPGSLTVYALNLNTESIILQFPHLQGQHHLDVFWLTPEKGDLQAQKVQLNGKTLAYDNDKLPPLVPKAVTSGSVTAPGKTFGYIVMPDANIAACKTPDHGTIIEHVVITIGHVVQEIDDMFVGVTISAGELHYSSFIDSMRSPKLINYVKALRPSYVRVGGTSADETTFDFNASKIHKTNVSGFSRYVVPGTFWDELNLFCRKSGLKLIFGFNALDRKYGKWDPTNAKALLQYSSQKGYDIAGFELGNEPNRFPLHSNLSVTEVQLAADFKELKKILETSTYRNSLLLGPDIAGYKVTFIKNFLSHVASVIDVVTYHQYYMNGATARVSDFTDVKKLDNFKNVYTTAVAIANQQHPRKEAWLGETSSAYGGGAVNISDRYVAGFLWLDKLGISARYGLKSVMRQTLNRGNSALLEKSSLEPNPDYWLTVLYKRLVGNKVFDVETSSPNIRVYAHCTKRQNQYSYKPGSLTVYALNLNSQSIILHFPHLQGQRHLDVFWLTPEKGDLQAQKVQLNGKTLAYTNDKLPSLTSKTVTSGSVTAPGKTFGYIVMPNANIAACKTPDHGTIIG